MVLGDGRAIVRSESRAAELSARRQTAFREGGTAEAATRTGILIPAVKIGAAPKVVIEICDVLEERQGFCRWRQKGASGISVPCHRRGGDYGRASAPQLHGFDRHRDRDGCSVPPEFGVDTPPHFAEKRQMLRRMRASGTGSGSSLEWTIICGRWRSGPMSAGRAWG